MPEELTLEQEFRDFFESCIQLLLKKNHDYGDSWKDYRPETITDHIRAKAQRVAQLEELARTGATPAIPEDIPGELRDIVNYSVFRFLKMDEYDERSAQNRSERGS